MEVDSFLTEPHDGAASCVLTTEGLLVELHEVGEDVFRDGLLVRKTLEQDDHLRLADSMHALSRHIPTLPVYVCESGDIRRRRELHQSHKHFILALFRYATLYMMAQLQVSCLKKLTSHFYVEIMTAILRS